MIKKPEPARSTRYMKWVKTQNCAVCYAPSDDAHHVISVGLGGGMGTKVDDILTIPLCRKHHTELHNSSSDFDQPLMLMKTLQNAVRSGVIIF